MNKKTFIKNGNNLLEVLYSETLNKLLKHCVDGYFPELKEQDIKIGYVISLNDFGGAKAGKWIVLFLPNHPNSVTVEYAKFKWIVLHELCHFVNLHHPDKIFKKKVPNDVWKLWKKLEKEKELKCDEGWAEQRKPEVIGKIN